MRLVFYCNGGSPTGRYPPQYEEGVGGAESALILLTSALAARGHQVEVYNDPLVPGEYPALDERGRPAGTVLWAARADYDPSFYADALILFRNPPDERAREQDTQLRVFWSCDQYTEGDYDDVFPWVQHTICISPYHKQFFLDEYANADTRLISPIDLGTRIADYDAAVARGVEKVPGRLIWCSVPDRGLPLLRRAWPRIRMAIPHVSLVITGDYSLWGPFPPGDEAHRRMWEGEPNVQYLGRVPRARLVEEQVKAQLMPTSFTYEEMFCIAAAEGQVAGAIPITSRLGALPTTNKWGILLGTTPLQEDAFVDELVARVVALLRDHARRSSMARRAQREGRKRFDYHRIASLWDDWLKAMLPTRHEKKYRLGYPAGRTQCTWIDIKRGVQCRRMALVGQPHCRYHKHKR